MKRFAGKFLFFSLAALLCLMSAMWKQSSKAAGRVYNAYDAQQIVIPDPPEPMIHGPRIVGTTPGKPFLFLMSATGKGPLTYGAKDLPQGLGLDPETGIISGSLRSPGNYNVRITVKNAKGSDSRNLVISGGPDNLCLTPPMGWNSWNVWGLSVSDQKVRAAAEAMASSGLAAHGYRFVNIDDGWENGRSEDGAILTNEKFPDMKALSDYVHGLGLKLGIYSSPGPRTCGLYEGSKGHEAQDAQTWAEWGIDYLKYDWCSYKIEVINNGLKPLSDPLVWFKTPYQKMGSLLAQSPRDIVFSICFYGLWDVEKWGQEVGGHLWRTTGDIRDTWQSMSKIGFRQHRLARYAGPGHWNDPDMLVVGKVGWGPDVKKTRLTKTEQITHITIWSMAAAPLLIGCDMSDMDEFTRAVLTNHDVIEVDQDPLGVQAVKVAEKGETLVWARPLWDGTKAVALFNRGETPAVVSVPWSRIGMEGARPVRDLWLMKDLGEYRDVFSAEVNPHGAVMLKIGKPEKADFSL